MRIVDENGDPNWNEMFIRTLEDPSPERHAKLTELASDFVATASTYGAMIIAEFFLNDRLKTVRLNPLGGVAGGNKFIIKGILFKVSGLYILLCVYIVLPICISSHHLCHFIIFILSVFLLGC